MYTWTDEPAALELYDSLATHVLCLPRETMLFHRTGPTTTVAAEKSVSQAQECRAEADDDRKSMQAWNPAYTLSSSERLPPLLTTAWPEANLLCSLLRCYVIMCRPTVFLVRQGGSSHTES